MGFRYGVAIRGDVYREHPWMAFNLYKAFVESKNVAREHLEDHMPSALFFGPVADGKERKNRLHLDLRPANQEAEVERLVDMGARHVDIGQGDVEWTVLADPEGNEFCVLREREE